jgi:peroxidase
LALIHTVFLREHNRVARQLRKINPRWIDNTLFQETRRVVVAEWQHIVYNEWLPIILGQETMKRFGLYPLTNGFSNNYKTDSDPRISNAFGAAAFRVGHTMIPATIM